MQCEEAKDRQLSMLLQIQTSSEIKQVNEQNSESLFKGYLPLLLSDGVTVTESFLC